MVPSDTAPFSNSFQTVPVSVLMPQLSICNLLNGVRQCCPMFLYIGARLTDGCGGAGAIIIIQFIIIIIIIIVIIIIM
jgi:hypothetical protein